METETRNSKETTAQPRKRFITPKELDEEGTMSLVFQWQMRKAGRLSYLKVGAKILYTQEHLDKFFAACEQNAA